MREELYKQLIALVLGGFLGVLFKYWYDYKATILKILWEKRYAAYIKLLALTAILPLYPQKEDVTYDELFKSSEKMRDWYFEEGGLLLSKKARDRYFEVQKEIQFVLNNKTGDAMLQKVNGEYEIVRNSFSRLRTELTNDLMSRTRLQGFFEGKNSEPKANEK